MAAKDQAQTITVQGKTYDVNKDFTWAELMAVEEFAGTGLAADGAFDSVAVAAGFIFVILRRENKTLTKDEFLASAVSDFDQDDAPANGNGGKPKRPTRAAKAAAS